jgi:hypothetical protein
MALRVPKSAILLIVIRRATYWRRTLRSMAERLRKRTSQVRWSDSATADLEHCTMLGFYAIRKLEESWELPDTILNLTVPVIVFPCIKRLRSPISWPDVEQNYDLAAGMPRKQTLPFLWNQFIHSFVFTPCFDPATRKLHGVIVSSNDRKNEAAYLVRLDEIIKTFDAVAAKGRHRLRIVPDATHLQKRIW